MSSDRVREWILKAMRETGRPMSVPELRDYINERWRHGATTDQIKNILKAQEFVVTGRDSINTSIRGRRAVNLYRPADD